MATPVETVRVMMTMMTPRKQEELEEVQEEVREEVQEEVREEVQEEEQEEVREEVREVGERAPPSLKCRCTSAILLQTAPPLSNAVPPLSNAVGYILPILLTSVWP
jgi:vacuolar-type H+-ATPase subunit E/Vma4